MGKRLVGDGLATGKPKKQPPKNGKKITIDIAKEYQSRSATKRKENNEKKALMSGIYKKYLTDKYKVSIRGLDGSITGEKELTGADTVQETIKAVMQNKDISSVQIMKEMRQALEGGEEHNSITVCISGETAKTF
jgi:hypothetical protein